MWYCVSITAELAPAYVNVIETCYTLVCRLLCIQVSSVGLPQSWLLLNSVPFLTGPKAVLPYHLWTVCSSRKTILGLWCFTLKIWLWYSNGSLLKWPFFIIFFVHHMIAVLHVWDEDFILFCVRGLFLYALMLFIFC